MADNTIESGKYQETQYFQLPLYTDSTPMDLRDGYNRAMRQIDRQLHAFEISLRENK